MHGNSIRLTKAIFFGHSNDTCTSSLLARVCRAYTVMFAKVIGIVFIIFFKGEEGWYHWKKDEMNHFHLHGLEVWLACLVAQKNLKPSVGDHMN